MRREVGGSRGGPEGGLWVLALQNVDSLLFVDRNLGLEGFVNALEKSRLCDIVGLNPTV